jgi:hypothetical protein
MKSLIKADKPPFPMGLLGYIILSVMLFTFSGCDLFFNKPEMDMGRRIDDAVAYANAADIQVIVRSKNVEEGISSPNGQVAAKQGYPITVQFAVSADYAFIEWEAVTNFSAYRTAADREAQLEHLAPEGSITVTDYRLDLDGNRTGEASIIVNTTEALTLVPYCIRRPYVVNHNLPNNFTEKKEINYPIQIWFNKPLDPECYNAANWKKNFIISAVTELGYSTPLTEAQMADLFTIPPMRGNVLTIEQNYDAANTVFRNCAITIRLNKSGIKSMVEGEPSLAMGEAGYYDLFYSVGASGYKDPPVVADVDVALALNVATLYSAPLTETAFKEATIASGPKHGPFIQEDANGDYVVYLFYYVNIDASRVSLRDLYVQENTGESILVSDLTKYTSGVSSNPQAVQAYFTKYSSHDSCYVTRYVLQKSDGLPLSEDGVLDLTIRPGDNLGNYTADGDAGEVSAYLDARKPNVTNLAAMYEPNDNRFKVTWTNPGDANLKTFNIFHKKNGGSDTSVDVYSKRNDAAPYFYITGIAKGDVCTLRTETENFSGVVGTPATLEVTAKSGARYVNQLPRGNGDGSSWDNASDDLQAMIDEAYVMETEKGQRGVVYGGQGS